MNDIDIIDIDVDIVNYGLYELNVFKIAKFFDVVRYKKFGFCLHTFLLT